MGTDIHTALEVLSEGIWKPVLHPNKWYGKFEDDYEPAESPEFEEARDRNYDAFAILADVRNGTGFAGVITGAGFKPISEPKGLPKDCSEIVRNYLERSSDHSHSWVTLKELLDVDWFQTSKHIGWVSAPTYYRFKQQQHWDKFKGPESYSGGVTGRDVQVIKNDEMDKLIEEVLQEAKSESPDGSVNAYKILGASGPLAMLNDGVPEKLKHVYTIVEWQELYSESAGHLYTRAIPAMKQLGNPEEVRMVFGFDS